jgi:hypothetical protein
LLGFVLRIAVSAMEVFTIRRNSRIVLARSIHALLLRPCFSAFQFPARAPARRSAT